MKFFTFFASRFIPRTHTQIWLYSMLCTLALFGPVVQAQDDRPEQNTATGSSPLTRSEEAKVTPAPVGHLDKGSGQRLYPSRKGKPPYNEKAFVAELLATREELNNRAAHFVFLVDVSDSVGDLLLNTWRNDLYGYLLRDFMVQAETNKSQSEENHPGDYVSVIPFASKLDLSERVTSRLKQPYQYHQEAKLKSLFPRKANIQTPKGHQGTETDAILLSAIKYFDEQGWTKSENLVIILLSDDIQQTVAANNGESGEGLFGIPGTYENRTLRYQASFNRQNTQSSDFTAYLYINSFPDEDAVFTTITGRKGTGRQEYVEKQQGTPASTPVVVTPTPTETAIPTDNTGKTLPLGAILKWAALLLLIGTLIAAWLIHDGAHYLVDYGSAPKMVFIKRKKTDPGIGMHNPNISTGKEFIGEFRVEGNFFQRADKLMLSPVGGYTIGTRSNNCGTKAINLKKRNDIFFKHSSKSNSTSDEGSTLPPLNSTSPPQNTNDPFGNSPLLSQTADSGNSLPPLPSLGFDTSNGSSSTFQPNTEGLQPANPYENKLLVSVTRRSGLKYINSRKKI